jgi:hypothetical protein
MYLDIDTSILEVTTIEKPSHDSSGLGSTARASWPIGDTEGRHHFNSTTLDYVVQQLGSPIE